MASHFSLSVHCCISSVTFSYPEYGGGMFSEMLVSLYTCSMTCHSAEAITAAKKLAANLWQHDSLL